MAAREGAEIELQDVSHRTSDHDSTSDDSTGHVFSFAPPPVRPDAATAAAAAAAAAAPVDSDIPWHIDDDEEDDHESTSHDMFDDPVFGAVSGERGVAARDEEHVDTPASPVVHRLKRRKSAAGMAGSLPQQPVSKDGPAGEIVDAPMPRSNYSRYTHGALPFDLAELLLVTEAYPVGGKRPDYLNLIGSSPSESLTESLAQSSTTLNSVASFSTLQLVRLQSV